MSVRPSSKDQYGCLLGSQHIGSIRSYMMPPIASDVQKTEQRLNTMAQIGQNPPKAQSLLVLDQNKYTPLHYQNTLITLSDLQKATSSSMST